MAALPRRIWPGCGSSWKQSRRQERARLAGAEVPWRGRLEQGGREVDWVTGLFSCEELRGDSAAAVNLADGWSSAESRGDAGRRRGAALAQAWWCAAHG